MKIFKNKSSRVLILVMGTLFILALLIANYYYKYQNLSLDPRVYEAHKLYERYNNLAVRGQYDSVFVLMDTIEKIYKSIDHYNRSYEVGVLYNNRAATYITMALDFKNDSVTKE